MCILIDQNVNKVSKLHVRMNKASKYAYHFPIDGMHKLIHFLLRVGKEIVSSGWKCNPEK